MENVYIFKNPNEITSFLSDNDFLRNLLKEAPQHIKRIFGEVPIHLELHNDPEENWSELFIVIKTSLSPKEAIDKENRLIEEWFLGVIEETDGKLNITEEPL